MPVIFNDVVSLWTHHCSMSNPYILIINTRTTELSLFALKKTNKKASFTCWEWRRPATPRTRLHLMNSAQPHGLSFVSLEIQFPSCRFVCQFSNFHIKLHITHCQAGCSGRIVSLKTLTIIFSPATDGCQASCFPKECRCPPEVPKFQTRILLAQARARENNSFWKINPNVIKKNGPSQHALPAYYGCLPILIHFSISST